jgi:hypothetical protein
MYILVHVSMYRCIRFRVPEKGSFPNAHKFSLVRIHVINTRIHSMSMKMKGIYLSGRFLSGFTIAAFRHNCVVEAASETFWELVKLIVTVNFDGFFCGIHHDMAFVAPMEMLIQLDFKVLADLAVKIIGQLF